MVHIGLLKQNTGYLDVITWIQARKGEGQSNDSRFCNDTKSIDTKELTLDALADPGAGVPGARPPTGPNSFIFAYIFAEKHPRQGSTPP